MQRALLHRFFTSSDIFQISYHPAMAEHSADRQINMLKVKVCRHVYVCMFAEIGPKTPTLQEIDILNQFLYFTIL